MPVLKLPDGSRREVAVGARSRDVAESIGKRLAKDAVAAKVDGDVVDLDRELPRRAKCRSPSSPPKDPEALDVLRHSCAHIMARAVMRLFPGVQLAFGPPTRERLLLRHRIADADHRGRLPAHRGRDAQDHRRRRAVRALRAARPPRPAASSPT